MRKYFLYIGSEAYTSYAYDSGYYTGVGASCERSAVRVYGVDDPAAPPEKIDTGVFQGTLVENAGPFPDWDTAKKTAAALLAKVKCQEEEAEAKRRARKAHLLGVIGKK